MRVSRRNPCPARRAVTLHSVAFFSSRRSATAPAAPRFRKGPVVGSPDGARQSGQTCRRKPRRPPPVLPLAKGELEGDRDGIAIALRQFRRRGVRQDRPGAAIPANPVPPSTLSSRKIRQDLSGTQPVDSRVPVILRLRLSPGSKHGRGLESRLKIREGKYSPPRSSPIFKSETSA